MGVLFRSESSETLYSSVEVAITNIIEPLVAVRVVYWDFSRYVLGYTVDEDEHGYYCYSVIL